MDLRPFKMNSADLATAKQLFAYQPFRIADDVATGVGYSWMHATQLDTLNAPKLVFGPSDPEWDQAIRANEKLMKSYSSFANAIYNSCPGGTYLDICCNTGYMPVLASQKGMSKAVGTDAGDFSGHVNFLNRITGSRANAMVSVYNVEDRTFRPELNKRYDAVSSMAFLFHTPEPLHFLKILAGLANHSVFIWSGFTRSDELSIRLPKPNQFHQHPFPYGFDAGTAISDTLLIYSMSKLGFVKFREIEPEADGWPKSWDNPLMFAYQPLRAFLFERS